MPDEEDLFGDDDNPPMSAAARSAEANAAVLRDMDRQRLALRGAAPAGAASDFVPEPQEEDFRTKREYNQARAKYWRDRGFNFNSVGEIQADFD